MLCCVVQQTDFVPWTSLYHIALQNMNISIIIYAEANSIDVLTQEDFL